MTGYNDYKFSQVPTGVAENRWAAEDEICRELSHIRLSSPRQISASGMPVVSNGNDIWVDNSDAHSLIIGSTGSKKTRLFVMPCLEILRKARESVVVTDPKGELYARSAESFRKAGYEVKVLNLRDPTHSDCWNPLKLARDYYKAGEYDKAASSISDLALCIIPDRPGSKIDPFWNQTSRSMLRGLCMMMVEREDIFPDRFVNLSMLQSLSEGMNRGSEPGPVYEYVTENYAENSMARTNLNSVVRGSEKTFGNICVSYDAALSPLYLQRSLIEMLSCNTIDFQSFGIKPTVLYLVVPDEKKTVNMIVSICVAQLYQQLIDTAQNSAGLTLPRRVNFVLDEFSNFPSIPDFDSMISAGRSRNIRFHLIVQGLEQLISRYGVETAQTIKANCQNWYYLCSREMSLLDEISSLCGENRDGTPLISRVQLQRLKKERGECLVLLGRNYPFLARLPDISEYVGQQDNPVQASYPTRDPRLFEYQNFWSLIESNEKPDLSEPTWAKYL